MTRGHAAVLLLAAGFGSLFLPAEARSADSSWTSETVTPIVRKCEEWPRNQFVYAAVGCGSVVLGWGTYCWFSGRVQRSRSSNRRLYDPDAPLADDPPGE